MRKANQTQLPDAEVEFMPENLARMRDFFRFPIDVKLQANINERKGFESNIRAANTAIAEYKQFKKESELALATLPSLPEERPAPSDKEMEEQLEALARLPWVARVWIDGTTQIRVLTRIVDIGDGNHRVEFMDPVTVPMPVYEISFGINRAAETSQWANTPNKLAIRLVDRRDVSKFVSKNVFAHIPYPHWAAGDGRELGSWTGLCLGEYEKDIDEAAKEGIVPFFTTLVTYLQTCGDSHAYMSKAVWAARMGKPEYADFCVRPIAKYETAEQIEERYKRDFKTMNQTEGVEPSQTSARATLTVDGIHSVLQDVHTYYTANIGDLWFEDEDEEVAE